ncbi:hypothetical protein BDV59DRAFT_177870 [Aspergillus ambiguus]|uniref:uncharacterized protein n=1 Tax=Aspergillus ambiguus TaxID=176160 RepID=UPI003CCCD0F0
MTTFEAMPSEIIESICKHIADEHMSSIYTFSLVNKRCCEISNVYRFRSIQLSAPCGKELRKSMEAWSKLLEKTSSFGHVRKLEVEITPSTEYHPNSKLGATYHGGSYWDDEFSNRARRYQHIFPDRVIFPAPNEEAQVWEPLARFIGHLTGLKDFIYACKTQLSPVILSVLHEVLPECNLHIRSFQLWSLHQHRDYPREIDPQEMTLATSPNLQSIVLPYYVWDSDELRNYNYEAALQIIEGMAPRLERIDFVYCPEITAWPDYVLRNFDAPPWIGPFFHQSPSKSQRQLRELGLSPVRLQHLQEIRDHIAFSDIRSLHLRGTVHDDSLDWLAKSCEFPSLKSLVLHAVDERADRVWSRVIDHYNSRGAAFIASLPPLESLELSADFGREAFDAILHHHGKSLKKFHLTPSHSPYALVLTQQHIEKMSIYCPHIVNLALPIPRTKSDAQEAGLYHALGAFKRLQRLSLVLDRSITLTPYWAGSIMAPNARDVIMNSAIDETLARSIFRTITEAHASVKSPLTWLRVEAGGDGIIRFNHRWLHNLFCNILRYLSGRFLCIRNPRNDGQGDIIVQEIGARERQLIGELAPDDLGYFEAIFRDIWPGKTGDWRKDWSSLPLISVKPATEENHG